MADPRPLSRDDIVDLRAHIDTQFSRLDSLMQDVSTKVEESARVNAVHEYMLTEIKIDLNKKPSVDRVTNIEEQIKNVKKGVWSIALAAILLIMRTAWEFVTKGDGPTI